VACRSALAVSLDALGEYKSALAEGCLAPPAACMLAQAVVCRPAQAVPAGYMVARAACRAALEPEAEPAVYRAALAEYKAALEPEAEQVVCTAAPAACRDEPEAQAVIADQTGGTAQLQAVPVVWFGAKAGLAPLARPTCSAVCWMAVPRCRACHGPAVQ
jgi:hypothetical protein